MWSWFWDGQKRWNDAAFLFLKDDTTSWYIGTKEKPLIESYVNLIKHYLDEYGIKPNKVFTIGSSMGGYAALLYGILFGVQATFSFRPQIDYENASLHFLVKNLQDSWIDLNELVKNYEYIPKIYLNYGNFLPDKQAAESFIKNLQKNCNIVIVHKTDNERHMGFVPNKDFIMKTLSYLDQVNLDGSCFRFFTF